MTIKQHGGVFGRNPTFNNVTVDGNLTVDQIVEKTSAAGITLDGVTLKDGNVVLADGKGIDFSATSGTGTTELFDDYEEGTFTPKLRYYTEGTASFTYSNQTGKYTKVGNVCYYSVDIRLSAFSKGTGSGSLLVMDFPFISENFSGFNTGLTSPYFLNWPYQTTAGYFPYFFISQFNSNFGTLYLSSSDASVVDIADPDADSMVFISGWYYTT